jgi:hypothetical protein
MLHFHQEGGNKKVLQQEGEPMKFVPPGGRPKEMGSTRRERLRKVKSVKSVPTGGSANEKCSIGWGRGNGKCPSRRERQRKVFHHMGEAKQDFHGVGQATIMSE